MALNKKIIDETCTIKTQRWCISPLKLLSFYSIICNKKKSANGYALIYWEN